MPMGIASDAFGMPRNDSLGGIASPAKGRPHKNTIGDCFATQSLSLHNYESPIHDYLSSFLFLY